MIRLYNSLSREKQEFTPIEPGKVRMYVCGLTVYDVPHLGHGRTFIAFDVIRRWLIERGYHVTFVRNITDIDDKIIRRAVENNEPISALTARMIQAMHEDFAALGILPVDQEPRATDYVPQMLGIIDKLVEKDLAYQAADGDVNYAVRKFQGYGKLSGKSLDELRAGERVAVDQAKRDPLDFVLWKSAKETEPADTKWASRWGAGRPGWHIECSAMSMALLGATLDIHGGGPDLKFPHHENEIAQSEGANGCTFANHWMHTGALNVDDEKMSKSLGNFFTIRDALAHYDPEVIRFFVLRSHYRSQLNYSEDLLVDARQSLTRLYTALKDTPPAASSSPIDWSNPWAARFAVAMDDDFNAPIAVSVMFELANEINKSHDPQLAGLLVQLGGVLGVLQRPAVSFLQGGTDDDLAAKIEARIAERALAKREKRWPDADRIRAELLADGVILEDSAAGTTWRKA